MCFVRLLHNWYQKQTMQVSWGNRLSDPFGVSNGVRQGGVLSPTLFAVYMYDLSAELNKRNSGCYVGNCLLNHLMLADYV